MNVSTTAPTESNRSVHFVAAASIILVAFLVCTGLTLRIWHEPMRQWIMALPLGIAFAYIIRLRTGWFPLLLISATVSAAAMGAALYPRPLWSGAIAGAGTLFALLCGRFIFAKFPRFSPDLARLQDATGLLFVAAPIVPLTHAAGHTAATYVTGEVRGDRLLSEYLAWYTGGVISIIVVTPLLLVWNKWPSFARARTAEACLILFAVTITAAIAFELVMQDRSSAYLLAFLPVPPVIWAAGRFGPRGATAAIAVVCAAAIYNAARAHDPLNPAALAQTLQLLPAFIAMMAATALCLAVSIAEAANAYDQLTRTQRRYRDLVEETNVIAWEADPITFSFTFVSGAAKSMLGHPLSEWLQPGFWERTIHPEDREGTVRACKLHLDKRTAHTMEYRMIAADGRTVWVEDIVSFRENQAGKLMLQGVLIDITQRKLQSQAIELSEQRFRDMFEGHNCVMLLIDFEQGIINDGNAAAAAFYGYPPSSLRGMPISVVNSADRALVRAAMLAAVRNERNQFEFVHRLSDGSMRDVEIYSSPVYHQGQTQLFSIIHDITERKQAQRDRDRLGAVMIHSQKMESLGLLAGGVAHDFNNLLTAIIGNAALARSMATQKSPLSATLQTIEQSAMRAADLTRQLLAYAGKGRIVTERIDVSALTVEMVNILAAAIPQSALITLDVAAGLPQVEADATQVRQVVMNMLTNAADALGGNAGKVSISTGQQELTAVDLQRASIPGNAVPGAYVYIEVQDTGIGMSEATMSRIFDPFFTTKSTGRGLGLAAVVGIVRGHGGAIIVRSSPGKGTTFRLLLPAAASRPMLSEHPGGALADHRIETKPNTRAKEKSLIVVVDDEPLVANLAATALAGAGYNTLVCTKPEEALLKIPKLKPAACIIDYNLPGMSGIDLVSRLRQRGLTSPIVFMSGGIEEPDSQERFLAKPFTPDELVASIQSAAASIT